MLLCNKTVHVRTKRVKHFELTHFLNYEKISNSSDHRDCIILCSK